METAGAAPPQPQRHQVLMMSTFFADMYNHKVTLISSSMRLRNCSAACKRRDSHLHDHRTVALIPIVPMVALHRQSSR